MIIITFQARHTNVGDSFEVRGELDDTYTICLPNQEPETNDENLEYRTFGHFRAFQDLSCSEHHVDVDYRTQDSGTTMRIKNVRIVAIQIGDIDGVNNAYQEAEGGVKGTTDWTDTVEASITPTDTNKKYLVIGALEAQPSTSTSYYAQARISVDDTSYIPVEAPTGKYWTSTTKDLGDWFSLMGYGVVTLTSGSHTVALQIKGHTTYSDYRYRRVLVLRLDDVYEYEYVSNPAENSQTGTTWKDASTLQFTSSASDYLILASMCGRLSTSGSSFQQRFTIGDVPQVDHIDHFEEQSDASYRSFQFAEIKTLLAESQTFKTQFRACDETRTAYVKGSIIVAIKRPLPVDTPPVWSNAGTNNTVAGEPTLFHVKWTDNAGLSGFIFGTNNTGTWVNDTWTPMSGTIDWSNITKILNSAFGATVQWRVWANDTSNNWSDTGLLSLTTTRAVITQLGLCFDGSGSISSSDFAIIKAGIAAAVRNASQMPHDGTVELTVVQFGTGITAWARVEVAPTVVTPDNFESIATTIEGISQIGGYTPTADGLLLTWLQMKGSPNFATATRQVINVATNGFANRALQAAHPVGWPNPPGDPWPDVAYVRDNAATEGLNEIDAEGIGVTEDSLADMRYYLVYPQPGNIAPPYTPGWVRWVANATEFAVAVGEKFITVLKQPVACFTVSNDSPNVCETVTFNATCSYDPDGWIVNYTWNFGDSNITTVSYPIITHHYDTFGNYTATLTVMDNDGLSDSTSKLIWVREHPVASFTYSPAYPQVCEEVVFNASASTPDGGTIISYEWSFGDGNITIIGDDEPITPIITHHYTASGDYNVTLTVTDSENKSDTTWKMITVTQVTPLEYYLTVQTDPAGIVTIPGENWYDNCTYVNLTAPEFVQVSGVRYRFDYWDVDDTSKGTGVNEITVHMDANHTATAHYVAQHYLTVISPYDTPGGQGWYDNCTYANATLVTGVVDHANGTRRVFTNWSGDASGTNYAKSDPIHMDQNKTAIANWKTQCYLTLTTNPPSVTTPSGEGWYDTGTYASISTPEFVPGGSRYRFTGWTTSNMSEITDPASPSTTVLMDEPKTVTANYIIQYKVTFTYTGLSSDATGTVVTVNGSAKTFGDLPFDIWIDTGSILTYSYEATVSSTISGKQYRLDSVTGPTSPITVTADTTVTGNYVTQYLVTFAQTGLDSTATGTVLTVNGDTKTFFDLPNTTWVDDGGSVSYSYSGTVSSSTSGKRFSLVGVTGPSSPISVTGPVTVTGNYKTQYYLTVISPYGTPGGEGWYDNCTYAYVTLDTDIVDHGNETRRVFTNWSGDASGTDYSQSDSIHMDGPKTAIANWKTQYYLNVTTDPGEVLTLDPLAVNGSGWYDSGSTAVVNAVQNVDKVLGSSRYDFNSWTGATPDGTKPGPNPATVLMDAPKTATANYVLQYRLTLAANPSITTPSGEGWYDTGTYASISTASLVDIVPGASRYSFSNWTTGDMGEIANAYLPSTTVLMDKAKTVTANYVTQYYLTVKTDPNGLSPQPDGEGWYNASTNVDLTAPDPSYLNSVAYNFTYWDVDGASQGSDVNPISVHMDTNHTATAHYQGPPPKYYLTVKTDPEGVETIPGEGWHDNCTYVDLNATEFVPVSLGVRYRFDYWDVDGANVSGNPITVHMDDNHTATAHYTMQYYLTVISPYGTPSGEGWYNSSTLAYAYLDTGMVDHGNDTRRVFTNWSGDASGTNYVQSNSIHMDAPKTAIAEWKTQYYLTVTSPYDTPGGMGWYDSSTDAYATLTTGTEDHGNGTRRVFTNWSGDASGTALTSDPITMNAPKTAVAIWKTEYYLTVTSPYGSPTPTSGWFEAGESITASVTSPVSGPAGTRYVCTGWTGTGSVPTPGTTTSVTFTINTPSNITWNWKTQYYLTVRTSPFGLSPAPTPTSQWYDETTNVDLTAYTVSGYTFDYWDVDGGSQGSGVNPISVHMDGPHTATAHYQPTAPPPPPPTGVGGYAAPINIDIDASNSPFPQIGLASVPPAAIAAAIILTRRRKKTSKREH